MKNRISSSKSYLKSSALIPTFPVDRMRRRPVFAGCGPDECRASAVNGVSSQRADPRANLQEHERLI